MKHKVMEYRGCSIYRERGYYRVVAGDKTWTEDTVEDAESAIDEMEDNNV